VFLVIGDRAFVLHSEWQRALNRGSECFGCLVCLVLSG